MQECIAVNIMKLIGGDRGNPVFASSLAITRFFASDLPALASEPSHSLGFYVRRHIHAKISPQ
jgi:hypothetical protein